MQLPTHASLHDRHSSMIYLHWSKSKHKRREDDQRQIHLPTHASLHEEEIRTKSKILSTWGNEQGTKKWMGELHARFPASPPTGYGLRKKRTVLDASSAISCLGTYTTNTPLLHCPKAVFLQLRAAGIWTWWLWNMDVVWVLKEMTCIAATGHRSGHTAEEARGIVCTCIEPGRPALSFAFGRELKG